MSDSPRTHKSLFEDLRTTFSGVDLETRGVNAINVAQKFMELLAEHIEDEDDFRRVASAWYKSVRDNDERKFKRALKKYNRKMENGG